MGSEMCIRDRHCTWAFAKDGYETIIVNNNPETVSTDFDIADKLYDCGMLIYEGETKCSGGSGCGCSAVVLGSCIMDRLIRGEYKRVLFVPTGALLSTVSYNEGKSVPGIAHGVILEGKES